MKKYRLPPLALFHTFEVAARNLSFTLAAAELCLTQGAVSRQIKALEDSTGIKLFLRKHRGIELTAEGAQLFRAVTRGLDEISSCLDGLQSATAYPQITVSASVSFAYYWLMPRLESFSAANPEIDLRVLASDSSVDLRREDLDVAILYGAGHWPGVKTDILFGEKVFPVCSQSYQDAHPQLLQPSDMLEQTLLHLEGGGNIWGSVDWRVWLARQGVSGTPVRRGIQINSYPMVLQAAEAGRGVALGWSYVVDDLIRDGRLICPLDAPLETLNGYYVGALSENTTNPMISAFIQWILHAACENRENG